MNSSLRCLGDGGQKTQWFSIGVIGNEDDERRWKEKRDWIPWVLLMSKKVRGRVKVGRWMDGWMEKVMSKGRLAKTHRTE